MPPTSIHPDRLPARGPLAAVRDGVRDALARRDAAARAALDGLAPAARALVVDGAGGVEAAVALALAHAADAAVADRVLARALGAAPPAPDDDPAARVLARPDRRLAAALRAVDRALAARSPEAARTLVEALGGVEGLYAASLAGGASARATKRRGGVETAPALVEQVLDLAGFDGRGRVLEPSAGSGAFLAAAWRRAARAGAPADLTGVELHPFVARALRARLALAAGPARALRAGPAPAGGGGLAGPAPRVVAGDVLDPGLALGGPFDLVVGNPPWVRGERLPAARRAALRARHPALGDGNVDLAAYVVARGLELLRPGGTLALVLPQGLLDARAAAGLRALLARRTLVAVLGLEWAPPCFAGASVVPCVVVVRDAPPPPGHRVRVAAPADPARPRWSRVPQAAWLRLGRGRLGVEVRRGDLPLLEALAAAPTPLRAGYGLAIRTAVGAAALVGDAAAAARFVRPRPLVDGREVRPWALAWAGRFVDDRPGALSDPKPAGFFAAPKVCAARIALTLQAAVDDGAAAVAPDGRALGAVWARNTVMIVRAPGTALDAAPHALVALLQAAPLRLFAHLVLRAAALAGSHRATFYAGAWRALPVPPALLAPGPDLAALEALGRRGEAAARAGDAPGLARVQAEVDARVADLLGLDARARRWLALRAGRDPVARLLRPPAGPGRRLAAKSFDPGARYR